MSSLDGGPEPPKSWVPIAIAVLAALALVPALLWLGLSRREPTAGLPGPDGAPRGGATAEPTEPWPTIPPTFTPSIRATRSPQRTPAPSPTRTPTPTPTPLMRPTASDITEVLELNVIRYRSTTVVEARNETWWRRDWVVLMIVGYVRVGFDLQQAQVPEPQVDGTRITLVLPHASVTSVELLPGESKVIDSNQALLWSRYEGLEMQASEMAKKAIEDAGRQEDAILQAAETIVQEKLTSLCRGLGYTEVVVQFEDEKS